ncbi:MAG: ATP-binding protein [Cyanobacteriota bacterium]
MNSTPRLPSVTNTRGHPPKFQQLIREKSENFVDRPFIFTTIHDFLHKYDRGYFTLIGAPGSGKSAILAKYVTEHPHVIYYNAQIEGKNRADEFLVTICNQLIDYLRVTTKDFSDTSLPDNATEGSWFLSLLLQKISDNLEPHQRLIIAIDALDAIAPNSQPASSNLFYLPRYLPAKVYFLLTRRPFVRERSRLLIEAPSQVLNLEDYPQQNRDDVQAYIQQWLREPGVRSQESGETEQNSSISPPLKRGVGGDLKELKERLIQQLTAQSENNFMYLSQILPAIAQDFSSKSFPINQLPSGLEAYYQSHLQRMTGESLSSVELGVLRCLATPQPSINPLLKQQEISAEFIAETIDEDEYEVEAVLENWIEFLQQQQIEGETYYRLYHSSFRHWLYQQFNLNQIS